MESTVSEGLDLLATSTLRQDEIPSLSIDVSGSVSLLEIRERLDPCLSRVGGNPSSLPPPGISWIPAYAGKDERIAAVNGDHRNMLHGVAFQGQKPIHSQALRMTVLKRLRASIAAGHVVFLAGIRRAGREWNWADH